MRVRLIENVGYMLVGSCPDLLTSEALWLVKNNKAVITPDSHKTIDTPPKDKMIRRKRTK